MWNTSPLWFHPRHYIALPFPSAAQWRYSLCPHLYGWHSFFKEALMATNTKAEARAKSFGENLESDLALEFLRVVENAAIASAHTMGQGDRKLARSEEHTSELQSRSDLVCRLLLEK